MSLGVLNNLSAMYAANNLNNTNNSLSKTLQQLSSGSKINSGADDAAGLSLVNGLQANATALSQSQTNATEGVGLLQVADGALSQVTNLLNRAVTLATEVSNGTLNASQDTAADQEYKSILAEIDNIGSTTTYNQRQVFGSTTQIYTGDSSSAGASIDQLSIGSLSRNAVGQAGGAMGYSSGKNLFVDLSKAAGAGNAQSTDGITAGSTMDITYVAGVDKNGNNITASATVATGGTTGYSNTVQGMIDAINGSGLGIHAQFATAAQAGDTTVGVGTTDTGIMITGNVTNAAAGLGVGAVGQVEVAADGTTPLKDTSTGVTPAAYDKDTPATGGTATITYTGNTGSDLSSTSLTSTGNAQTTLTALNTAISNVASQDGYIGAQINTLNAASSVISTQQQNIVAAQNAVQATDYATASSNMSKYQILSQTGISALAQANSAQQEVLKLLQ